MALQHDRHHRTGRVEEEREHEGGRKHGLHRRVWRTSPPPALPLSLLRALREPPLHRYRREAGAKEQHR